MTEQLSDELIDEVMQEFDLLDLPEPFLRSTLDLAESAPRLGTAAPSSDTAITPQPAFRLTFDQDAFVARQSETLTLTGTIQGQQAGDPAIGEIADPWDSNGEAASAPNRKLDRSSFICVTPKLWKSWSAINSPCPPQLKPSACASPYLLTWTRA